MRVFAEYCQKQTFHLDKGTTGFFVEKLLNFCWSPKMPNFMALARVIKGIDFAMEFGYC